MEGGKKPPVLWDAGQGLGAALFFNTSICTRALKHFLQCSGARGARGDSGSACFFLQWLGRDGLCSHGGTERSGAAQRSFRLAEGSLVILTRLVLRTSLVG